MAYKNQVFKERGCSVCDVKFIPTAPRNFLCSNKCKQEHRRKYAVKKYSELEETERLRRQNKRHQLRIEHREIIKKYILNYRNENPCVICGCTDHRCLQFHHKDAYTKRKTISELIRNGASLQRVKEEIELCDIVCANCHLIIHYEHRGKNKNGMDKDDYNPEY